MSGEIKWTLSRKLAAVAFVLLIIFGNYALYTGMVSFQESLRSYVTLVLPFVVLSIVSKREKAKKKRQQAEAKVVAQPG